MTGESTHDAARRRREREQQAGRATAPPRLGGAEAMSHAIAGLPATWSVLHDVRWPGRRDLTIDHVVVGTTGLYVIHTVGWSGEVDVVDGVLRQGGRSREWVVDTVAEAGLAVGRVSQRLDLTQAVLCLRSGEPVTGRARDVLLCSSANLVEELTGRPTALTPEQVREVARDLDGVLRAATAARGPVVPRPRRAPDDVGLRPPPVAAAPAEPERPRLRISAAPSRPEGSRSSRTPGGSRRARVTGLVADLLAGHPRSRLLARLALGVVVVVGAFLVVGPLVDLAFWLGDRIGNAMVTR